MTTTLASLTSTAIGAVIGGTGKHLDHGWHHRDDDDGHEERSRHFDVEWNDRKYLYRRVNHQRRQQSM